MFINSDEAWDYEGCTNFIRSRRFSRVALQFPDELLPFANTVLHELSQRVRSSEQSGAVEIFLLADTTFNSLAVDEVAAAHISADCVIHYGHASLSPVSTLPAYFVFPSRPLDVEALFQHVTSLASAQSPHETLLILLDLAYIHCRQRLVDRLKGSGPAAVVVADVPSRILEPSRPPQSGPERPASSTAGTSARGVPHNCESAPHDAPCCALAGQPDAGAAAAPSAFDHRYPIGGLCWEQCTGQERAGGACCMLWVGPNQDSAALTQLLMTFSTRAWRFYDPATGEAREGAPEEIARRLMRRHFLVEKAKNCAILGVLVGTLGVAGYLSVIERLRRLAKAAGKKTYTMLMGKPTPTKLANFPEVEVWVQVADPQAMLLDSKEYLAPIITPFEAELALRDLEWDVSKYRLDFASVLESSAAPDVAPRSSPRFSLIDGAYHQGASADGDEGGAASSSSLALAVQADRALQLAATATDRQKILIQPSNAAEFMALKRSYHGAPSPLVGSEAKTAERAVPGLSGRAAGYASERDKQRD